MTYKQIKLGNELKIENTETGEQLHYDGEEFEGVKTEDEIEKAYEIESPSGKWVELPPTINADDVEFYRSRGANVRQIARLKPEQKQEQPVHSCPTCQLVDDCYTYRTRYSPPDYSCHTPKEQPVQQEAPVEERAKLPNLEIVAEKVHDSWMKEKAEKGFHAPLKCQSANRESYKNTDWQNQERFDAHFDAKFYKWCDKCHPDMYPYSELSESIKDLDRATVRTVFAAIADSHSPKDLADITDEELYQIANIQYAPEYLENVKAIGDNIIEIIRCNLSGIIETNVRAYQYLESKGYKLPKYY